jgi:hypothetical protein
MRSESFPETADILRRSIDEAMPRLRAIAASSTSAPVTAGKWSPKQIIGHLIDSASNNHQRFVRAQQGRALVFPKYEQEHWVRSQHYDEREWDDLLTLWHAYNHHVAHVISHLSEADRNVPCTIGSSEPVTLGFLATDYGDHLRHHLRQILDTR